MKNFKEELIKNMSKLKEEEYFYFQALIKGEVELYGGNVPAEKTMIFKIKRLPIKNGKVVKC